MKTSIQSIAFLVAVIGLSPNVARAASQLLQIVGRTQVSAGVCTTAFSVLTENSSGVATAVTSNTTIALSSGGSAAFYGDPACTTPVTSVVIAPGTYEQSFYVIDPKPETVTIKATQPSYTQAVYVVSVMAPVATSVGAKFAAPSPQQVGECIPFNVTVYDQNGYPFAESANTSANLSALGYVQIDSDSNCATSAASVEIAAGTSSATAYVHDPFMESSSVTASAGGLTSRTVSVSFSGGYPAQVQAEGPGLIFPGRCMPGYTLKLVDSYGYPAMKDVTYSASMQLSALSGGVPVNGGFYSDSACQAPISTLNTAALLAIYGQGKSLYPIEGTYYFMSPSSGNLAVSSTVQKYTGPGLVTGTVSNALPVSATAAIPKATVDPAIGAAISGVSAANISSTIQTLSAYTTRNSCSAGLAPVTNWISGKYKAIPNIHTLLDPFPVPGCATAISQNNVVAWLPGKDPSRLVIMGGHYDSRTVNVVDSASAAPGANDSGSQTAALLEAARVLSGMSLDATVVFASFAGEEQGLLGSAHLVQTLGTYFPGSQVELMLNADIIGGDNTANSAADLQEYRLFSPGIPRENSETYPDGTTDNMSPSRNLMRTIGFIAPAYVSQITLIPKLREDRPTRSGDHISFIQAGYPAVRFMDAKENLAHEHTASDLSTYVTPSHAAQITQIMAAVGATLASASTPPALNSVSGSSASSLTLNWSAPKKGPAVDHFEILIRPSTDSFYEVRIPIGGGFQSATVTQNQTAMPPGSVYYVSVSAVDSAGHESLPSYPEYRCTAMECSVPSYSGDMTVKL